jgi:hypothetical protein
MFELLGRNVGDHLRAAVANVLSPEPQHLEQAIFAELSATSMASVDLLMRAHWKSLVTSIVPALQQLIDADRAADRVRDQRVRIGQYTYHETTTPAADSVAGAKPPRAPNGRRKT